MGILSKVFNRVRPTAYHCCLQKTASRWVTRIINDDSIMKIIGGKSIDPGVDFITDKSHIEKLESGFPGYSLVSPLYINYDDFRRLKKEKEYRAIWVARDFRDVMVSQFFSIVYSHAVINDNHEKLRRTLQNTDFEPAFAMFLKEIYPVEDKEFSYSIALRSWLTAADNKKVKIVKYEDITGSDASKHWQDIFSHYKLSVPQSVVDGLLEKYSFEKLTKRKRGEEDVNSHLRSGLPGDWKKYFSEDLKTMFKTNVNDILIGYGYETDSNW